VTTRPHGRKPDFGKRAAVYDRLRPYDDNWRDVAETLIREADLAGRRVLDVGCGTGRFLAQLAQVAKAWGVDASPEMLEVARTRAGVAGLKLGTAEQLPFKDGWFERATMWLVAHLLDRPRAFAEAARVLEPGGRFAVATFDPSYFDEFWLNELFPSMETADRERFPTGDELTAELALFEEVRLIRLSQTGSLTREVALERIRGKHISTFDLIDEEEYRAGLQRAERELPERVDYRVEWLIAVAVRQTV
jgi:ubiquinone/menaquinone biosynthesis C-methylase UbiE